MSQIQSLGATGGGGITAVNAGDSTTNLAAGLLSATVGTTTTISLTNRYRGTSTTADETPANIITIPLGAVAGVYVVDVDIVAFNTTDTLWAGYKIFWVCRTDATDSVLCGTPDKIVNEEAGNAAADANMVAGGVADNNLYVVITGIAMKDMKWNAVATYTFVSA